MGNLSLNKELDFILTVNELIERYERKKAKETAAKLRTSSKMDRSRNFIDELREEGRQQAFILERLAVAER